MRQLSIREMDRRVDLTIAVFGVAAAVAGLIAEKWPATAVALIAALVAAAFVLLAYVEPTLRPSTWSHDAQRAPGGYHCGSCGAAVAGQASHCCACGQVFRLAVSGRRERRA
jgi:hypothetical protein